MNVGTELKSPDKYLKLVNDNLVKKGSDFTKLEKSPSPHTPLCHSNPYNYLKPFTLKMHIHILRSSKPVRHSALP
jgi:hypothetical protein